MTYHPQGKGEAQAEDDAIAHAGLEGRGGHVDDRRSVAFGGNAAPMKSHSPGLEVEYVQDACDAPTGRTCSSYITARSESEIADREIYAGPMEGGRYYIASPNLHNV